MLQNYYEEVFASDCFEDNNEGLEYGVNCGEFHTDIQEQGDSYGSSWFATAQERETYIQEELLTCTDMSYKNIDDLLI